MSPKPSQEGHTILMIITLDFLYMFHDTKMLLLKGGKLSGINVVAIYTLRVHLVRIC